MQYPFAGRSDATGPALGRYTFMIKLLTPSLLLPLACIGCAEKAEPQPDPAKLQAFLATLDAPEAAPGKTERLIASVEKIPPERINPRLALAVVTK